MLIVLLTYACSSHRSYDSRYHAYHEAVLDQLVAEYNNSSNSTSGGGSGGGSGDGDKTGGSSGGSDGDGGENKSGGGGDAAKALRLKLKKCTMLKDVHNNTQSVASSFSVVG